MTNERFESACWLVFGIVAIAGLYFIISLFVSTTKANTDKAKTVRVVKVEVCRTITDEAIRAFCVINGGAGDRG